MDTKPKTLIVIAGPTASGKTAVAIQVAKHFKTVVVSADSRQFYREMTIGTAKPDANDLLTVQHYFINSHSVTESVSVGDYERSCLKLLAELFKEYNNVVLTGGSGLFIKAVVDGFDDIPVANESIRSGLNKEFNDKGLMFLQEKLKIVDPDYFKEVDINNPQRIIRALEVFESTGQKFSLFRKAAIVNRPFKAIRFGLNMERQKLYDRINNRVDLMMANGLLEEVRTLMPYRSLNALNTVGYRELFDYFDGKMELPSAIMAIKQNTRRYAKRQLTWFKKDNKMIWMDALSANLINDIISKANNFIKQID